MMLWLILLSSALVLHWLFFRQSRLQLPGPKGLPILGSVLDIDSARSHVTFMKWVQKHGPIFVVNMFREQVILVNDHATIQEVLVNRGEEFNERGDAYRLKLVSRDYNNILTGSPSSPHWRPMRKAAHKYVKVYGDGGSQNFERLIGDAINDQMHRIAEYQGKAFNVRQELYNFGECIMYMLLFGERLEPNSEEAREIRDMIEKVVRNTSVAGSGVLLDLFPWLRFLRNKTYDNIMKANEELDRFWKKRKMQLERDSFVKHIMTLKNSLKSDQGELILDDTNVIMAMVDLLAAGSTTTIASVSVFILLLLHYPEVQRKLQQEVDVVIGRHDRVTLAKRDEMPYSRACIYELLRYATVVPLLPHAASKDTTLSGEFIPKGTKVIVNLWNLHHDEEFWGDPWSYRPERYLDLNGDLLPADHPNRKRLLAFSAGPRVCIGEVFALNRLFLFIISLLQKFDVCPDSTKELPSRDPRTYVTGLVVHPEDFTVSMVPRGISPQ